MAGFQVGDRWIDDCTSGELESMLSHDARIVSAADEMLDSGHLIGWEFRGRPVTNIEMYAIVAAGQRGQRAILRRWCDRLIQWIDNHGEFPDDDFTDSLTQPGRAGGIADGSLAEERFLSDR